MWIIWQETKAIFADLWEWLTDSAHLAYLGWLDIRPALPMGCTLISIFVLDIALLFLPIAAVADNVILYPMNVAASKFTGEETPSPFLMSPLLGIVMFVSGIFLMFFLGELWERVDKRLEGKPKPEQPAAQPEQDVQPAAANDDPLMPFYVAGQQSENK